MEKRSIHDTVKYVHNAINRIPGCVFGGSILETGFGEVPKLSIDVFITENNFPNSVVSETNFGVSVKKIIFNPPATIVFWTDGTEYNPYFGFYAAVTKKVFGNNHRIEKCIKDKGVMEKHHRKAVKEVMDEGDVNNVDNVAKIQKEIRVECAKHRTCGECPLFEHAKDSDYLCYAPNLSYRDLLEHYSIMFGKEWEGEIEE